MFSRKAFLAVIAVVVVTIAFAAAYVRMQMTPEPGTEIGFGGGAILPVNGTIVSTVEEAARLVKAETPIRLPTYVPSSMVYVKIIGLKAAYGGFEGGTIYIFYSDEPIADTNNPLVLIHLHWGVKHEDVTGGAPDMVIFVDKLDPEIVPKITADSVRKYAEENNLTFMMIGDAPAFGYEPKELPFWSQPIGALTFYKGDLCYMISSHLPLKEMVKIAESIIEQY